MAAVVEPVTYTQKNRRIAISTPLGEDALLLRGFNGHDGISQLFRFDLDLLALDGAIDFDKVVGKPATVRISLAANNERYFNGLISRFSQGGRDQDLHVYHAELVPWLWTLTRTADCRIFQNKSVPEIIKQIFSENAFGDFSMQNLTSRYVDREYCVQYRETDFNFVSRLLEEEGISYFFVHGKAKHTIMFVDSADGHPDCPFHDKVRYHEPGTGNRSDDVVTDWESSQEMCPAAYVLNDFNYKDPGTSMLATVSRHRGSEIFDYPGGYLRQDDGENLVRVRLEEANVAKFRIYGNGDCRSFTSGHKFTLTGHPRADQNQEFLLTRVHHTASQTGNFASGAVGAGETNLYTNAFECIPSSTPFRPARISPKPVIQGSQTAIVVGEKGEEITQDSGRVKVQFHWDRKGQRNENSSCWIRVSQSWAGNGWGMVSIPRIGQEVVVTFLEGDADQPLITGSVYNGQKVPPFVHETGAIMGFRSNSTKGGEGYNEIIINDTKSAELVRLHGQKDMHTTVLNDQKEIVKNNKNLHVCKELRTEVEEKASHSVKGDVAQHFAKNHAEVVGQERYIKASRIILEADQEICIKVGGNHVHISSAGVYLEGAMVDLNCGHSPANTSLSGLTPTSPEDPT